MKITRDNYEEFFLDYLDGNLDESLYDQFIEFLQLNPDLKEELRTLKTYSSEPEEVVFKGKEKLYKSKYDSQKEFDFAAVAAIEGDLEPVEKSLFSEYLAKNPEKEKEFEKFKKTKLVVDESVVFGKKASVYKTSGVRRFIYYTSRIAAVLVMIFSVGILLRHYSGIETPAEKIVKQISEPVDVTRATTQPTTPEVLTENPALTAKVNQPFAKVQPRPEITPVQPAISDERETEVLHILASISPVVKNSLPEIALAEINPSNPGKAEVKNYQDEKPMLGDVIKEKAGIERFHLNSITKAGLKLMSGISKNKVSYDTNKEGDITEINFDSRLLAFSIPTQSTSGRE